MFLEDTDLLTIEDILPFFLDFVVIEDFKENVCMALEGFSAHADSLEIEIDKTTKDAEAIIADSNTLRNWFVLIDAFNQCTECNVILLIRQFYAFVSTPSTWTVSSV